MTANSPRCTIIIMFYLIRHGEADYSEMGTKIYQGHGLNLVPLTERGILQIRETAKDARLKNAGIIVSSPFTRAVQTAAILSKKLQIDIIVETDIHEWQADKNFIFLQGEAAERQFKEYNLYNGEYPKGTELLFETNTMLRNRLHKVLEKYKSFKNVIVVCHGTLIHSVFQDKWFENGEIGEYDF